MPKPTEKDISTLEVHFTDLVVFSEEEMQRTAQKFQSVMISKLLGQGFALDFIQHKMKKRCLIEGDFQVSILSEESH